MEKRKKQGTLLVLTASSNTGYLRGTGHGSRKPHLHVGRDLSLMDVLIFFERTNNMSQLSLLHNTRSLKLRTTTSVAIGVLDDSALTVLSDTPASGRVSRSLRELYDYHTLAGVNDIIIADKHVSPGKKGYSMNDIIDFFEGALSGSGKAGKTRLAFSGMAASTLASNIRAYFSEESGCKRTCDYELDRDKLDAMASVLHHYYMVYLAFLHTNSLLYAMSADVSAVDRRRLVSGGSPGLASTTALMDVMGVLPSTILLDIHAIMDSVMEDAPLRLVHLHDIARLSSYVAILHTYNIKSID